MSRPRIQKISLDFNQIDSLIETTDGQRALLLMAEDDKDGVVHHAIITNPIIFFLGNASTEEKAAYLAKIFAKTTNTVCLNIDNLLEIFNFPVNTEFTNNYSYENRIKKPAHEVILKLAQDNLHIGKQVILTGNFDDQLTANYITNNFPDFKKAVIRVIYLNNPNPIEGEPDYINLEALAAKVMSFQTSQTIKDYEEALLNFLANSTRAEENVNSKPILAMSAGLAGVGKTTSFIFTSKSYNGSVFLQKDTIGLPFLNNVNQDMSGAYYTIHVKDQTYKALFSLALNNLKLNRSAIVDGWFGDKLTCSWLKPHLGATAYTTTLVYFHCSEPTELARVQERGADRDEARLRTFSDKRKSDLEKHLQDFSQIVNPASIHFVDTDDDSTLNNNVNQILAHFRSPDLVSLQINAENKLAFAITAQEAQANIATFKTLLARSSVTDWQSFWKVKNKIAPTTELHNATSPKKTLS